MLAGSGFHSVYQESWWQSLDENKSRVGVPRVFQSLENLKNLVSILNYPFRFVHVHSEHWEGTRQTLKFVY